jgi:hypothetical protein
MQAADFPLTITFNANDSTTEAWAEDLRDKLGHENVFLQRQRGVQRQVTILNRRCKQLTREEVANIADPGRPARRAAELLTAVRTGGTFVTGPARDSTVWAALKRVWDYLPITARINAAVIGGDGRAMRALTAEDLQQLVKAVADAPVLAGRPPWLTVLTELIASSLDGNIVISVTPEDAAYVVAKLQCLPARLRCKFQYKLGRWRMITPSITKSDVATVRLETLDLLTDDAAVAATIEAAAKRVYDASVFTIAPRDEHGLMVLMNMNTELRGTLDLRVDIDANRCSLDNDATIDDVVIAGATYPPTGAQWPALQSTLEVYAALYNTAFPVPLPDAAQLSVSALASKYAFGGKTVDIPASTPAPTLALAPTPTPAPTPAPTPGSPPKTQTLPFSPPKTQTLPFFRPGDKYHTFAPPTDYLLCPPAPPMLQCPAVPRAAPRPAAPRPAAPKPAAPRPAPWPCIHCECLPSDDCYHDCDCEYPEPDVYYYSDSNSTDTEEEEVTQCAAPSITHRIRSWLMRE